MPIDTSATKITPALIQYIEAEIFPQYAQNDKGHQSEHIRYVIRRSLLFMEQFHGLNADMVYTAAAYHDIAHHIDKDRHEVLSAAVLQQDNALKVFFTEAQIQTMKEAIEDHRAATTERSSRLPTGRQTLTDF